MLYAKLRSNDLHIHINLAGIIIEHDEGAFDAVINYLDFVSPPFHLNELYYRCFQRYLRYHDLPFEKDSIDMIFVTFRNYPKFEGDEGDYRRKTWNKEDRYHTRQLYKRTDNVPLTIATYTRKVHESCAGVHEIGRALNVEHDPLNEVFAVDIQCYGLMQTKGPNCFNCMNWSPESIKSLQDFTRSNKDRCFLLNYPRSLNPPGPRETLSPYEQCRCYEYQFYGQPGKKLKQVPASDCGKPLRCESVYPDRDTLLILPLDGTPCGQNKVCWVGNCVDI